MPPYLPLTHLMRNLGQPTTRTGPSQQALIQRFTQANPTWTGAFEQARESRHQQPRHIPLRNAEHALFGKAMMEQFPVTGPLMTAVAPPVYSGIKHVAQTRPILRPMVDWAMTRVHPSFQPSQSTPPDFGEILAGWAPLWGGVQR